MSPDTYIVTSNADDGSTGTRRAAIMYANANPGTTISFDSMLTGATITLTSELPLILGDQTIIDGSGAPHLTISGNDKFRVFFVGDTTHTVSATTFSKITMRRLNGTGLLPNSRTARH